MAAQYDEKLAQLIEPAVKEAGLELWDADIDNGGNIRVFLEKTGSRVGIDDCTRASRAIDAVLTNANFFNNEYSLEVGSPGINRRLRTQAHFERYIGSQVKAVTREKLNNENVFEGKLLEAGPSHIKVEAKTGEAVIAFDILKKASLQEEPF